MNTLITPAQAVALAFADGEYLAPESVTQSDIAAAEQRYLVPVIGRLLYEKLLSGSHAGFTTEYLAAPAALFTRIALQPRLELQRSLRRQARTLLRRAAEHLETHAAEFPEYDPHKNILNRCTTDGNFVQTR